MSGYEVKKDISSRYVNGNKEYQIVVSYSYSDTFDDQEDALETMEDKAEEMKDRVEQKDEEEAEEVRCGEPTQDGTACKNMTTDPSGKCWLHRTR